jgi:anti-sigma B factor antagonist
MQIQQEADVVVLAVLGPTFDASNAKTIKSKIGPVVESATKLVLDMTAVRFMHSTGLGVMLGALRQLTAKGGEMKIFGLSTAVRSLFELVRLQKLVDIYNTREEALASFRN